MIRQLDFFAGSLLIYFGFFSVICLLMIVICWLIVGCSLFIASMMRQFRVPLLFM